MPTPINVFICYKKMLAGERPNEKAGILHFILAEDQGRFKPWIDEGIAGGLAWETAIYREILTSDVLLVLVGPGTSESPWVRREIALSTALGIAIVPLGFDLTRDQMDAELKALDIGHLQGKTTNSINLAKREVLLTELRGDLLAASSRTKEQKPERLRGMLAHMNPPIETAANNQRAATFMMKTDTRPIRLHVASGDMFRVRDIDVMVNSENDYMQMARFFESRTISSLLRRKGARVLPGRYEDTIQQELDWQLGDRSRPVQVAEVFVTSAGGPGSELADINRVRYIFHVAAVQAVDAEGIVIPFKQAHQIERCVRTTLVKAKDLNRNRGIVSPPGTEQRELQQRLADEGRGIVRSILFPLFGTGQAGNTADYVIKPMLESLADFFNDPENRELAEVLDDIYISAFKQNDFEQVVGQLQKHFA